PVAVLCRPLLLHPFPTRRSSDLALAEVARDLNLGSYVLLGKGELATGGPDKDSILSDTLEAVLGSIYLSHGMETARAVVHRILRSEEHTSELQSRFDLVCRLLLE